MRFFHSVHTFKTIAVLALGLCLSQAIVLAQSDPTEALKIKQRSSNLITNNPFAPNTGNGINSTKKIIRQSQNKDGVAGPLGKYLQFKSIVIIDGVKHFSVYNKRMNKSFWIPEGETIESLSVQNYNVTDNSITLSDGISSEKLWIVSPDDKPLSVASAQFAPAQSVKKKALPATAQAQAKTNTRPPLPRRRVIPVKTK